MPYRLSFAGQIRSRLSAFKDKAKAIGLGKDLAHVLSNIVQDLTQRPMDVGEVMYHLRHVPMPVKHLVNAYISVVFVVNESDQFVVVTKMTMLSEHPFPKGYDRFFNS